MDLENKLKEELMTLFKNKLNEDSIPERQEFLDQRYDKFVFSLNIDLPLNYQNPDDKEEKGLIYITKMPLDDDFIYEIILKFMGGKGTLKKRISQNEYLDLIIDYCHFLIL